MSWNGGWFGPSGATTGASGARAERTGTVGLTAALLINAARDRSPLFDREHHLDGTLLRALTSQERRLVGKMLLVNPSSVAETLTITLASYDFAAGQALPAFHHIDGAIATPTDTGYRPFELFEVSWSNRLRPPSGRLSYCRHGGNVYLSGTADDWDSIASVAVSYAPIPGDLTALTDRLVVPDTAQAALESFLAYFMAARTPAADMPPAELARFRDEAAQAEADFLAEMASDYVVPTFRVTESWT